MSNGYIASLLLLVAAAWGADTEVLREEVCQSLAWSSPYHRGDSRADGSMDDEDHTGLAGWVQVLPWQAAGRQYSRIFKRLRLYFNCPKG